MDLAGRIQEVAARILTGSVREHQLTQAANIQVAAGTPKAPTTTIDETPRSMVAILAEWRDAERRASAAEPGSAEESEARALAEALRDEYQRAYDDANRH